MSEKLVEFLKLRRELAKISNYFPEVEREALGIVQCRLEELAQTQRKLPLIRRLMQPLGEMFQSSEQRFLNQLTLLNGVGTAPAHGDIVVFNPLDRGINRFEPDPCLEKRTIENSLYAPKDLDSHGIGFTFKEKYMHNSRLFLPGIITLYGELRSDGTLDFWKVVGTKPTWSRTYLTLSILGKDENSELILMTWNTKKEERRLFKGSMSGYYVVLADARIVPEATQDLFIKTAYLGFEEVGRTDNATFVQTKRIIRKGVNPETIEFTRVLPATEELSGTTSKLLT